MWYRRFSDPEDNDHCGLLNVHDRVDEYFSKNERSIFSRKVQEGGFSILFAGLDSNDRTRNQSCPEREMTEFSERMGQGTCPRVPFSCFTASKESVIIGLQNNYVFIKEESYTMDEKNIMEYANKAIEAFKGDSNLLSGFSVNPAEIIEKILGIDLPDDIINKVIEAVKGLLAGGALDAAKDAISGIAGDAADAAGAVADKAENAAGAVADKAQDAAEEGGNILTNAINKIKNLF